jgi:hypothetical protein
MPVIISGTTGISGTDGSASIPAVQGTDANTGMFFPAADTIAFSEGGTEVMRINASGQVEYTLGTASLPSITATGDTNTGIYFPAADQIAFTEGGTEAMRINASGNVGIGTATPATSGLTVAKPSGAAGLQVSSGANNADFVISATDLYVANSSNGPTQFWNNGSERARFHSGGQFSLNTTSILGRMSMRWDNAGEQGFGFIPLTETYNGSPIVFYNS